MLVPLRRGFSVSDQPQLTPTESRGNPPLSGELRLVRVARCNTDATRNGRFVRAMFRPSRTLGEWRASTLRIVNSWWRVYRRVHALGKLRHRRRGGCGILRLVAGAPSDLRRLPDPRGHHCRRIGGSDLGVAHQPRALAAGLLTSARQHQQQSRDRGARPPIYPNSGPPLSRRTPGPPSPW